MFDNTDRSQTLSWNIDRYKVDWNILWHVYSVWFLSNRHVYFVDTWGARVVEVVVLVFVVVIVREFYLELQDYRLRKMKPRKSL